MDSIADIERFRQLRESITKENAYLLVGLDIGKQSSAACLYCHQEGILQKRFRFEHTHEGCKKINDLITTYRTQYGLTEVIIGVEPTASYHKAVCEYLRRQDYRVIYVSNVAAAHNRRTLHGGRWGKNDPRDAYNVVDLMKQGKIQWYRGESAPELDLRKYLMYRKRLVTNLSALKTRVRNNIWTCHFPELDDLFINAADPDVCAILEHCPSAAQIQNMSLQSFISLFPATSQIHKTRLTRIKHVWHAAHHSIGFPASPSVVFEAKNISRDLKVLQHDIGAIDVILRQHCDATKNISQLLTIPGFGMVTTAAFIATVGDIARFNHPQQIVKLAGIDIEFKQSGSYQGDEHISKKGNALLRFALSAAVNVAVSRNKQLRTLFQEKLRLLGNSKQARAKLKIKIMEKFIRIAFVLLKKNVPFNIQYLTVPMRESDHNYVGA